MHDTYREALHGYAREFLRLLHVLGVSKADIARAWEVTPPFVTFVVQGSKSLPPNQQRILRRLLRQAVRVQRQRLKTADAKARQHLRDQLLPAVINLDGTAQALAMSYVASVRTLHQEALAYAEALAEVACAPQVADAAWQAVAQVENTLASLHEVFGNMKSRNRKFKVVLDQQAELDDLLNYIETVYGSDEHAPQEDAAPREPRRARQRRLRSTPTGKG